MIYMKNQRQHIVYFSRAFCNFVFPKEIIRPLPKDGKDISNIILDDNADEDLLDAMKVKK